MSKEMEKKIRGSARKGTSFMTKRYNRRYRYRRFQALDDALCVYFEMKNRDSWVTVRDIAQMMDWDEEDRSVNRRIRRICESLRRVGRVQTKQHGQWQPMFIRTLE